MSWNKLPLCLPTLLVWVCAPVAAQATCGGGNTIFACTTTNNKVVEVCDAGKTIEYSFGRRGQKPEMALAIPRARASTSQWHGVGRHMSYSVNIPNGDTVYTVFQSVDRLMEESEGSPVSAGIHVEVKGKHVATIPCNLNKHFENRLEGVNLRPES